MGSAVAGAADQLEVFESVAAAARERDDVMDLQVGAAGAAADADAVAGADGLADRTPFPAASYLASRVPVVARRRASFTPAAGAGQLAAVEARPG